MRLTVYPYMASEVQFDKFISINQQTFVNPINEEYFDIVGFEVEDDGTLSFVMGFAGGKMVKRAASMQLSKNEIFQLRKVLDDSGRIGISVNSG